MSWFANWWTSHAEVPSTDHDPYLTEGLTASSYAAKQADLRLSLRNHFEMMWKDVQSWLEVIKVPGLESMSVYDFDDT